MLGQLSQCSDWSAGWMNSGHIPDKGWDSYLPCLLDWLHPVKPKKLPCCYCIKLSQPLIWWVPGALNPGVQQPWAKADHSPLSSTNITREYSHISNPPDAFRAHTGATSLLHYSSNSMTVQNPFWHSRVQKLMCYPLQGLRTSLYFGVIHH
jgi:hypothetical protein